MPIKKSELYSSLWASCDALRGGMDASQYKDFVLTMLFIKYVSDKYAGKPFAPIKVPDGASFDDVMALKGDKEIGDKLNKQIIGRLADANPQLKGVINIADFNDPNLLGQGKEMVDRLSDLVAIFENPALDFSANRAEDDDLLGDAYEYLMRNFAVQSGKSKGQFLTPAEVSRVIAQVVGIRHAERQDQTLHDPTCGSGSLLLKAAAVAPSGISIFGQEINNVTAALAKMNMILHAMPSGNIRHGNSLADPQGSKNHQLKTFDFVVANPPFSDKSWRAGFDPENNLYERFTFGKTILIPPKRNGDYAYLLHILKSLKSTGKAAVVMPHGVLFRGNVEADIRRELVRRGAIKGIIGLPPNLFYGTGIPACIIVLDKEHAAARTGLFMIDASAGFVKDGNKNRLRHQDIRKIVDVFNAQRELPRYSRMVSRAEIEANEYNLNIPRYIDTTEPEDVQDIAAHLHGGIPRRDIDALARYWEVFPGIRADLFTPAGDGRVTVKTQRHTRMAHFASPDDQTQDFETQDVETQDVASLQDHPEFAAYTANVTAVFDQWRDAHRPRLLALDRGDSPRALINDLSETLLHAFEPIRLINRYDVYQHLMTYWAEVMQDDVYMITLTEEHRAEDDPESGWLAANKLRLLKGRSKEQADLKIGKLKYKVDLIPPEIIVARYFAEERAKIAALEAEKDAVTQEREAMEEEHSGEDGLLEEAKSDAGNVTKGAAQALLKEIQNTPNHVETQNLASDHLETQNLASLQEVLTQYLDLRNQETHLGRKIRQAEKALDAQVVARYKALTEDEVKALVVDAKWLAALEETIQVETQNIASHLTGRVGELAERYAAPLPEIVAEADALSERVAGHLERMGFAVNE